MNHPQNLWTNSYKLNKPLTQKPLQCYKLQPKINGNLMNNNALCYELRLQNYIFNKAHYAPFQI